MKTSNLLLFCAEAGFAFLMGDVGDTTWTGIAAFETRFFAVSHCRSLRGVTFSTWRKSPKTRTGRGCFDSPSPCEPSPATTEVGLRSPFWNPLRLVQCLTLPTDFFAKINLVKKRRWLAEALPSLEGIEGKPRTVSLRRFKGGDSKGAGKTQSPPLL